MYLNAVVWSIWSNTSLFEGSAIQEVPKIIIVIIIVIREKENRKYARLERDAFIWAICETGRRSNKRWNLHLVKRRKAWKRNGVSYSVAAQDQAIRTSYVKATIDRSQDDPKCRMCRQETVRPSAKLQVGARNWRRRNTKRGITM